MSLITLIILLVSLPAITRMLHVRFYLTPTILNMGNYFMLNNNPKLTMNIFENSYSFAIVGINLTHLAYTLWKDQSAKTHAYNLCCQQLSIPGPTILHFHRFYCFLFVEFDKLWVAEKPASIMEFGRIRSQFEKIIRLQLANRNCLFKLNIPVEHV